MTERVNLVNRVRESNNDLNLNLERNEGVPHGARGSVLVGKGKDLLRFQLNKGEAGMKHLPSIVLV